MSKNKTIVIWVISVLAAFLIGMFQRRFGPTYPVSDTQKIQDITIEYRFLRSFHSGVDCPVKIKPSDFGLSARLEYRRVNSEDKWGEFKKEMVRDGEYLKAAIPTQPVAGKVEYRIMVTIDGIGTYLNGKRSIIVRFRGDVPGVFLISHIIFMFAGLIFAIRTGLEALFKGRGYVWMVNFAFYILVIGGAVLGPIVQYYAFNDAWTGFPFGSDLTDNKTLIVLIFWFIAFILKKKSKFWVYLAIVIMLVAYFIPHSLLGSEYNYKSGQMNNKYGYQIDRINFNGWI